MILEVFPSGPFDTNAILIGCPKTLRGVIVDAPFGGTEVLIARSLELSLTIEKLLLTHSHWDHIAEAALLKEKLNVPIYVHELDAPNLKNPGSDKLPLLFAFRGVEPNFFLHDTQELCVGVLKFRVLHTPGHTPGGVCFYLEEEGVLISGDTLFRGSMGNIHFPTASPEQMWASLKKLSKLPPKTRVFPGHGEATTIGDESWIAHAQERFG